MKQKMAIVDAELDRRMPAADTRPGILHEAMRYSVFTGGKRLRPILCLAAYGAVGGTEDNADDWQAAMTAACAIELFHTYTLIHDDLPAMDDDDLRRGEPTCHKKFGEANAILAGDALLTLAFEWLADYQEFVKELAQAGGSQGVVGGQMEDLQAEGKKADEKLLQYIHLHKTAQLIRASVRMGAMAGKVSDAELADLSEYGEKIGMAFQIADDLMDEKEDRQMTAIDVWGKDGARKRARMLIQAAYQALEKVSGDKQVLQTLANFVIERAY